MLILPAIDLAEGRAVRWVMGDRRRSLPFVQDPVDLARHYAEQGADWLHLVDLDGAQAGRWCQLSLAERIIAAVTIPVQVGGGARSRDQVQAALDAGAQRVIVGTIAVESPDEIITWASRFGEQLVVSLDSRHGRLLTRGWVDGLDTPLLFLARRLSEGGVRRFVYTDTSRDGTLAGSDLTELITLIPLGRPVLAAGGIAGYRDLVSLRDAGAEGAIIGRALLEGRLDVRRAVDVVRSGSG